MQLTQFTDFSLRILLYLSRKPENQLISIVEVSDFFDVSRPHLVKAAKNLAHHGFISTSRGKGGGMKLARSPEQINLADVVRITEPNFDLVECFDLKNNQCRIEKACKLKGVLYKSRKAFMDVLGEYTLADAASDGSNRLSKNEMEL